MTLIIEITDVSCEELHIQKHVRNGGAASKCDNWQISFQKTNKQNIFNWEINVQNIKLWVTNHDSVSKCTAILRRVDGKVTKMGPSACLKHFMIGTVILNKLISPLIFTHALEKLHRPRSLISGKLIRSLSHDKTIKITACTHKLALKRTQYQTWIFISTTTFVNT